MKKFLVCLAVLVSVGQTFSGPASFVTRTGLQAMESTLQIRTQNIASQNNVDIFPAVEFLNRLNTFSKASANLDPRLSERLYSALITATSSPQQSRNISETTLVNAANMLINIGIIRREIETYELTEEPEGEETSQPSAVFVQDSLPRSDDADDLTDFASSY
ncbi:MAG: hypothetical protein ACK4V2_00515 [Pseudomonadota bacterium]|jgi:hypothetical protein|nr:hypothetical protein [Alphaproteobacteria bacterium]